MLQHIFHGNIFQSNKELGLIITDRNYKTCTNLSFCNFKNTVVVILEMSCLTFHSWRTNIIIIPHMSIIMNKIIFRSFDWLDINRSFTEYTGGWNENAITPSETRVTFAWKESVRAHIFFVSNALEDKGLFNVTPATKQ